jgi:hypothetical protein
MAASILNRAETEGIDKLFKVYSRRLISCPLKGEKVLEERRRGLSWRYHGFSKPQARMSVLRRGIIRGSQ